MNIPIIPSTFATEEKINPPKIFSPQSPHNRHAKGRIKNMLSLIVFVGLTAGLVGIGWNVASKQLANKSTRTAGTLPKVAGTKSMDINQSFLFDATDRFGKKLDQQIEFTITSAEKTKQIILKGKHATAVEGRTFLIVNLKLKNQNDIGAVMHTRELIRLLPESLAPDIHNDPVEIQPIATKLTRVGFAINENAQGLQLQIGTIKGDKTTIDLNL